MSISRYCIDRPIFASVVSIVITLAGAVAMLNLPIAQYPDITPIQISVSATYPGAAADVVSNSVAAPMEQQINGADNMLYMSSSSSSSGNTTISVYFEIGTSPELAQVDVQNRVNLALPLLPESVQKTGVSVQKRSGAFMMVISLYSPDARYDEQFVANYANLYVLDALKRIPGAGQASVMGLPDLAMRIWLKPDRMAQLGVSASDVQRAVAAQNQQFAVGSIGQSPTGRTVEQSFAVTTRGRMTEPAEFDNIIIRAARDGGAIVRLKDVGRAELGARDYSVRGKFNGKPATTLVVYQQPGANALEVSKNVTAALAEMKKTFPEGIDYQIAISVVISGVVALTLSPALAGLLLKPGHHEKKGFFKWFEASFATMTAGYSRMVALMIKRSIVGLLLFAGMIVISLQLMKTIPGSFLPVEDQGYLLGAVIMPDAASLDRTADVSRHVTDFFMKNPATKSVVVVDGYSLLDGQIKSNASTFFIGLKVFGERYSSDNIRTQNARAVITDAFKTFSKVREGIILPINPPSIPGLGTTGKLEAYIQAKGEGGLTQATAVIADFTAKARDHPELGAITSTFNASSQQLLVDVDRDKAGNMVPLKAVVNSKFVTGPPIVTRFNNFPAVKITVNPATGYSSGQAIAAVEAVAADVLPSDYGLAWTGQAYEEKKSGGASTLVFVFGLIMVFLILAAQYEKWSLPFGVLLAVPFALFGALLAILLRGLDNDVYFQIGLTMLVALAAKNAILIFEFAVLNREAGQSIYDAVMNAAHDRLRPIIMTSLAFILGCVPLAISTGVSAGSKHSIGTGVIGGMLGATVIAVFFIPMFYYLIETLSEKLTGRKAPAPAGNAPMEPAADAGPHTGQPGAGER